MDGVKDVGLSEEEIGFLSTELSSLGKELNTDKIITKKQFLSREDLIRLDKEEPWWRRARWLLFAGFWFVWVALLVASVLIVIFTPKCPVKPDLQFWQSKVGYWVNAFAFKDSNSDLIGDFNGLSDSIDYIRDLGAGYIILSPINLGEYTNAGDRLGLVEDFKKIDPALGSMDDFRRFVRHCHKNGVEVVLTINFNSISPVHLWTKRSGFLEPLTSSTSLPSRGKNHAKAEFNGSEYYSLDGTTLDLNLTSPDVLDSIKDVLEFWMSQDIDGFNLENAAFFVEDIDSSFNGSSWFSSYPSSQLFHEGSVNVVREVRKFLDEKPKAGVKEKFLLVDPGNTGYGLLAYNTPDLMFLSTENDSLAHSVVSRHFVLNRGEKNTKTSLLSPSVLLYSKIPGNQMKHLALTTSTASDPRYDDYISAASTLLLPGIPLIYYGSELVTRYGSTTESPTDVFPKGKSYFPNLSEVDSVLTCSVPMPWDKTGAGFSATASGNVFSSFVNKFNITETLNSVLSAGRGPTPFKMVKELIALRKEPSLLFGTFEWLDETKQSSESDLDIFVRRAEGFPAFIVVFNRIVYDRRVVSFASVCPQVIPMLTYPPVPDLLINKTVDSHRIFIQTHFQPIVYVFKCA